MAFFHHQDRTEPSQEMSRGSSLLFVAQVNAHASRLHDPQCARDGLTLQDCQEIAKSPDNRLKRSPRSKLQDDDPGALSRRKSQNVAEVVIERDQHPAFGGADIEQFLIGAPAQILLAYRHYIVTGRFEHFQATTADVLVELELHAAWSVGTGTMRSRAASAP